MSKSWTRHKPQGASERLATAPAVHQEGSRCRLPITGNPRLRGGAAKASASECSDRLWVVTRGGRGGARVAAKRRLGRRPRPRIPGRERSEPSFRGGGRSEGSVGGAGPRAHTAEPSRAPAIHDSYRAVRLRTGCHRGLGRPADHLVCWAGIGVCGRLPDSCAGRECGQLRWSCDSRSGPCDCRQLSILMWDGNGDGRTGR